MGVSGGPNIIRDSSLVLELDAADRNSYPGSGTTWNDLTANNNSGTLTNGPTFNSANLGSIVFDGTNDYFQTLTSPINNNSSSFSIECFIQFSNFNNNAFFPIIDAGNFGGGQVGYGLAKNNSNRLYLSVDAGYVDINTTINNNQWYHIIGVALYAIPYSISLYINGALIIPFSSNSTNTLTISQSSARISRGYIGSGLTLYGAFNLPNIRMYNRALSAQEVLQNYNATKTRFGL